MLFFPELRIVIFNFFSVMFRLFSLTFLTFDGLPGFPLGSCVDSGLSLLPEAPVGNGGTSGNRFFGEVPIFALGFARSGVDGFCLYSVLCCEFSAFLLFAQPVLFWLFPVRLYFDVALQQTL